MGMTSDHRELTIDTDSPGGNIVVDHIDGGTCQVLRDPRDTGVRPLAWTKAGAIATSASIA